MTLNSNFVRFEISTDKFYRSDEKKHVVFWWKCQECGCEYSTRSSGNVKALCNRCAKQKKDALRKETFDRQKKRVVASIVSDIRNNLLEPADLPSITIDNEEYVSKKIIKRRLRELRSIYQNDENIEINEKE